MEQFQSGLREFININVGSVDDPRVLWDLVKGFIGSNSTLYSSNVRKLRSAKLVQFLWRRWSWEGGVGGRVGCFVLCSFVCVWFDVFFVFLFISSFVVTCMFVISVLK